MNKLKEKAIKFIENNFDNVIWTDVISKDENDGLEYNYFECKYKPNDVFMKAISDKIAVVGSIVIDYREPMSMWIELIPLKNNKSIDNKLFNFGSIVEDIYGKKIIEDLHYFRLEIDDENSLNFDNLEIEFY